jgi:hypothetical protein
MIRALLFLFTLVRRRIILRSSARMRRPPSGAVPYARGCAKGRTRLRLGGTVQDPTDGVYHHFRLIPLDEVPAALYDTVGTIE